MSQPPGRKRGRLISTSWVLVTSAQGGLMVALPTLLGLAVGYWLDLQFNTLPWITIALTLAGAAAGPVMLYRWVTTVVKRRVEQRNAANDEEMAE